MSPTPSYLTSLLPVENVSINTISLLSVMILFILHLIPKWVGRICILLSTVHSSLHSQLDESKSPAMKRNRDLEPTKKEEVDGEGFLCREEVEMVMGRLGFSCHKEGNKLPERLNSGELSRIFEEKEPSLEEVKEAFDVFDNNGDGYIDERELQRVLCNLGLKEGVEVERCRRMIGATDNNGDGRIDFSEFVKLMEGTFY
ncbi:hypothetical protein NMG60_11028433 [Bertholletia excelsa]